MADVDLVLALVVLPVLEEPAAVVVGVVGERLEVFLAMPAKVVGA